MFRIQRKFVESCLLLMLLITFFLLASLSATAQNRTDSLGKSTASESQSRANISTGRGAEQHRQRLKSAQNHAGTPA